MFFISNRTKASFYNNSQMTFLVEKDCVDIFFKVQKGVYLTVQVYSLAEVVKTEQTVTAKTAMLLQI